MDVAFWTVTDTDTAAAAESKGEKTLMLVANTNQENVSIVLSGAAGAVVQVLNSGASLEVGGSSGQPAEQASVTIQLDAIGAAAYIFEEENLIKSAILLSRV